MANEATTGGAGRSGASRAQTTDRDERSATERNAETLAEQVDTLRSDLAAVTATLGDLMRSGAREGRASVERTAGLYMRQGRDQADAALEGARAYGEALEGKIARNPFSAVLVALGLGFLVGLMSRR